MREEHHPKKQQRWTRRPRAPGRQECYKTKGNMPTQKPPAGTRLAGTPVLFKVRVLEAGTKNPGPLTPPHGHRNLKVEPQTKATATWRAERKAGATQADPPTSSLGLTPRSEASAKHEEQLVLHEPEAAKSPLLRKPLRSPGTAGSQHSGDSLTTRRS